MAHNSALVIFFLAFASLGLTEGALETVFQWKYFDFVWPSQAIKEQAIRSGSYDYSNIKPYDIDVSQDGRVFISFPYFDGTPARFGFITNKRDVSGPLIQPYPHWGWFNGNNCDNTILTIVRFKIDQCNRLWMVDNGIQGFNSRCLPKMLVFDLSTNTLLLRETIPNNIAYGFQGRGSNPTTIVIDTHKSDCSDAIAYIADSFSDALIVWNGQRFHRFESPEFHPQPGQSEVFTGSISAPINFGLSSMDLSPQTFPGEPQFLFLRPIASRGLFAINTAALKNNQLNNNVKIEGNRNVLSSQTIAQVFSSKGILFFGLTREFGLACWNRYKALDRQNIDIVAQDYRRLDFLSGMKVIKRPIVQDEEIWMIASRSVAHYHKRLNFAEFNFFVTKSSVNDLIRGTKCETPRQNFGPFQNFRNNFRQ